MIKRVLSVVLVFLMLTSCGIALDNDNGDHDDNNNEGEVQLPPNRDDDQEAFKNEYQTILMENVSSSNILLHEKVAFLSIEFNVRDSIMYSAGKDFYSISFVSSSKPEDSIEVYVDYLDDVSDQFENEYNRTIEGYINNRAIVVTIDLTYNDNFLGYLIRLRISEEASKFQDNNRYFDGYPDLVELYQVSNQPHYYYLERYDDDFKEYYITYSSGGSANGFVEFYTENYNQKTNFTFNEDDYQKRFSWVDSGYEHSTVFQISNNMVSVNVKTKLP